MDKDMSGADVPEDWFETVHYVSSEVVLAKEGDLCAWCKRPAYGFGPEVAMREAGMSDWFHLRPLPYCAICLQLFEADRFGEDDAAAFEAIEKMKKLLAIEYPG